MQEKDTKLTAYFKLVQDGWRAEGLQLPLGEPLYYGDVPRWYTWGKTNLKWKVRQRRGAKHDKVIGRIFAVPPKDTDRFYLRLLLLATPNAHGYEGPEGLRDNDTISWRRAAELRGLVETDEEYSDVLSEAALTEMPSVLRDLFVQLLVHCGLSKPLALWETHQSNLASDFVLKATSQERGIDAALFEIDQLLHTHGVTSASFGLPTPTQFNPEEFDNRHLRQALSFDIHDEKKRADLKIPQLTPGQREIFEAVKDAVHLGDSTSRGRAFYVDGPGGSGKTFLYENIIHHVHSTNQIALACAISGIAATLLPGGTTAHSLFGLPIDMPSHGALSSIKAQEGRAEVLRRAAVILLDEASMFPLAAFDCVGYVVRGILDRKKNDIRSASAAACLAG